MFHVIRVMGDIFDHVFEQVVAGKNWVKLAGFVITLKINEDFG